LRRTISSMIEDPLSEDILRNKYAGKQIIRISIDGPPESDDCKFVFEGVASADEAENAAPVPTGETT